MNVLPLFLAAPVGLALQIGTPQSSVLVGEPLKLIVTWKAIGAPVSGLYVENADFTNQSLLFLVEGDAGAKRFVEAPRSLDERISPRVSLKPGEQLVTNLVLFRGGYVAKPKDRPVEGLIFPSKGKYSIKAAYVESQQWIESNAISIVVSEPTGSDRQILADSLQDRRILEANGSAETQRHAKELIAKYARSPYLRWARLNVLKERGEALHNQYDPDTRESLYQLGQASLAQVRTRHYRQMARDILADDWGPFEEEALALAHLYAGAAGDQDSVERARKVLFEEYPSSSAVKQIMDNETADDDDNEPPVKPSPKPKQ